MGESILKPIVVALTFVAIGIMLIGTTNRVAYSNIRSNSDIDFDIQDIGGLNYTVWHDSQGGGNDGILIDASLTTTRPPPMLRDTDNVGKMAGYYRSPSDPDPLTGVKRGDVALDVIRNNTDLGSTDAGTSGYSTLYYNMLMITQNQGNWVGDKWRWSQISFETIIEREKGNQSTIPMMLGQRNFTVFVVNANNSNPLSVNLYLNNYTVFVGQLWGAELAGKVSMWSIIGRLLTFSLPGVPPVISYLIGFPFWMVIGFSIMTLISRFIPTIPGG